LAANKLQLDFEFASRTIDKIVEWVTENELWLSNVLPDSLVLVLFVALGAYSLIQFQYPL
jgi:hypothetical protein